MQTKIKVSKYLNLIIILVLKFEIETSTISDII